MTQFICGRCIRTIDAEKVAFCSLIDNSDYYCKYANEIFGSIKITNYKSFGIYINGTEIFIVPDHINEVMTYIVNELGESPTEEDRDRVANYVASWMSRINEKLYKAFIGNSIEGKTDGYITASRGFDGIDINVEMLARQIRLNDLATETKEETNDGNNENNSDTSTT